MSYSLFTTSDFNYNFSYEWTDPVAELEALRHKYSELLKSQEFLQSEASILYEHDCCTILPVQALKMYC